MKKPLFVAISNRKYVAGKYAVTVLSARYKHSVKNQDVLLNLLTPLKLNYYG